MRQNSPFKLWREKRWEKRVKYLKSWSGGKKGGNLILQKSWEKGTYPGGALS